MQLPWLEGCQGLHQSLFCSMPPWQASSDRDWLCWRWWPHAAAAAGRRRQVHGSRRRAAATTSAAHACAAKAGLSDMQHCKFECSCLHDPGTYRFWDGCANPPCSAISNRCKLVQLRICALGMSSRCILQQQRLQFCHPAFPERLQQSLLAGACCRAVSANGWLSPRHDAVINASIYLIGYRTLPLLGSGMWVCCASVTMLNGPSTPCIQYSARSSSIVP